MKVTSEAKKVNSATHIQIGHAGIRPEFVSQTKLQQEGYNAVKQQSAIGNVDPKAMRKELQSSNFDLGHEQGAV